MDREELTNFGDPQASTSLGEKRNARHYPVLFAQRSISYHAGLSPDGKCLDPSTVVAFKRGDHGCGSGIVWPGNDVAYATDDRAG